MAISIIAALTEAGRNLIADMTVSGRGFQVLQFVVGTGGVDPGDPLTPLSPDPGESTLPGQIFGPKALLQPTPPYSGALLTPFCPQFQGLLDYTEANDALSDYGLIATIISSPIPDDPLIGTQVLFAYGTTPLKVKTDGDQFQLTFTLQT